MRQYWRVQQSQTIISMAFATSYYSHSGHTFVGGLCDDSTIGGIPQYLGLIAIGSTVIVLVLLVGVIYDVTFGLWREHMTIIAEKPIPNLSNGLFFNYTNAATNIAVRLPP